MNIDDVIRLAVGEKRAPVIVGRIPRPYNTVVGCSARAVRLSYDTLKKQLCRHADFKIEYFEHLPWILENGQPLYDRYKDNVVHFVADCRDMMGYWVKVTVKSSRCGDELWMTSAHRLRIRDLRRLKRNARRSGR